MGKVRVTLTLDGPEAKALERLAELFEIEHRGVERGHIRSKVANRYLGEALLCLEDEMDSGFEVPFCPRFELAKGEWRHSERLNGERSIKRDNIVEFVNEAAEEAAEDTCEDAPIPYRPPQYYLRKFRNEFNADALKQRFSHSAAYLISALAEDIEVNHNSFRKYDMSPPRVWDWAQVYRWAIPNNKIAEDEQTTWAFENGRITWIRTGERNQS